MGEMMVAATFWIKINTHQAQTSVWRGVTSLSRSTQMTPNHMLSSCG